ncbi:MAG: hypothetical protein J07AB43_15640 [Candidatus Nanosalina sp. J07AB43]|jgi:hypothetical protein|nr:MAG: hypothetical protein J07AB43_15640 [Candidatus Nanosalina sp. J07AB43]
MSNKNQDWIDEIVGAEPRFEIDSLPESEAEKFVSKYDSAERVWADVSRRDHEDSSFRLPFEEEDSVNCLGRALLTGMYDELASEGDGSKVTIYFDENFAEDGTTELKYPHVTVTVDCVEYGGVPENAEPDNKLDLEALADLYKVGLGVKQLEHDEGIEDLDYGDLEHWGDEINEKYSASEEDGGSEYLRKQGYQMRQEAEKRRIEEENSDDSTDFIIG